MGRQYNIKSMIFSSIHSWGFLRNCFTITVETHHIDSTKDDILNSRTLVCTVVGLLAVGLLLLLTPSQHFLPKGIALPAKTTLPATSAKQITIYLRPPAGHFVKVGQVRAEMHFNTLNPKMKKKLFDQVKSLAATLGANGVIIRLLEPDDGVRHMITFMGMAIHTASENGAQKHEH